MKTDDLQTNSQQCYKYLNHENRRSSVVLEMLQVTSIKRHMVQLFQLSHAS